MWLAASVVIIRDGSSEPINPPTGYWPDITLITPDIINYWFLLSPTKHIIYFKIPGTLRWELTHSSKIHISENKTKYFKLRLFQTDVHTE